MKAAEYKRMAELEDYYWWHTGRKSIISRQLKRFGLPKTARILNVGSGTGGLTPVLAQYGRVSNVDVSPHAVKHTKAKGYGETRLFDGLKLPFNGPIFDVVVATDVLEHIADDGAALQDWARVLKPGGRVILTVPAYQWLWSSHDESLKHHRRYSASEVHRKLNAAGLAVDKRTYVIVFSFPLIVGFRLLQGLNPLKKTTQTSYVILPEPVNRLFQIILQIEARALEIISFPFGTSVLAVGTKQEQAKKPQAS